MRSSLLAVLPVAAAAAISACGSEEPRDGFVNEVAPNDAGTDVGPGFTGEGTACLECNIVACGDAPKTTITGKVFDPAGVNPLYNVIVYIPGGNEPEKLPPLKDSTVDGIACETCDSVVLNPLRSTLTDGKGQFVLEDVPVQKNVPIVVQIGKWRRLLHIDVTEKCAENKVADGTLRLPKNGSEGDMPQIAVTTGESDALECLLRGIGVDDKEFVEGDGASGHVHLFKGHGGGMGTPAEDFWNDGAHLRKYDMVLLSCEGEDYEDNKGGDTPGARASMHEYLNAGGRVFASHYHYIWFLDSPAAEFKNLASWGAPYSAPKTGKVNQSFPKGAQLAEWLDMVGASSSPGTINLANLEISETKVNEPALEWITAPTGEPIYFTVNTPISNSDGTPTDPAAQCGRAVLTGLHVADVGGPRKITSCSVASGELNPQQAALEFLVFDLSSCVTNDQVAPRPPR